jgi:hypothetical protein
MITDGSEYRRRVELEPVFVGPGQHHLRQPALRGDVRLYQRFGVDRLRSRDRGHLPEPYGAGSRISALFADQWTGERRRWSGHRHRGPEHAVPDAPAEGHTACDSDGEYAGSALGGDVNYLSIANYIVGIAEFVYNAMVAGANMVINFATAMVNLGLAVINGLGQIMNAVVAAATEVVVEAFNAFVTWAITFITDTLNVLFRPIINGITEIVDDYCVAVLSAIQYITDEKGRTGTVSEKAISQLVNALDGDLFESFFLMSIALEIALLALTIVTNIYSFLLIFVTSVALGFIIDQALNAGSAAQSTVSVNNGLVQTAAEDGTVTVSGCMSVRASTGINEVSPTGIGFGIIDLAVSQWVLKIQSGVYLMAKSVAGSVSLAIGGIALALSAYATANNDKEIAKVAIDVGIGGLIFDAIELAFIKLRTPLASICIETTSLAMNTISLCISGYVYVSG